MKRHNRDNDGNEERKLKRIKLPTLKGASSIESFRGYDEHEGASDSESEEAKIYIEVESDAIVSLDISAASNTAVEVNDVLDTVNNSSTLESLIFHDKNIKEEEMTSIINSLETHKSIRKLSVFLPSSGHASIISEALKSNTSITNLTMRNVGYGDFKGLSEALLINKTITKLTLKPCKMPPYDDEVKEGSEAFAKVVAENNTLRSLAFDQCFTGYRAFLPIAEALKLNKNLTALHNGTILNANVIRSLGDALSVNKSIQHIKVCTLLRQATTFFARAMLCNTSLISVYFFCNPQPEEKAIEFAFKESKNVLFGKFVTHNKMGTAYYGSTDISKTPTHSRLERRYEFVVKLATSWIKHKISNCPLDYTMGTMFRYKAAISYIMLHTPKILNVDYNEAIGKSAAFEIQNAYESNPLLHSLNVCKDPKNNESQLTTLIHIPSCVLMHIISFVKELELEDKLALPLLNIS